MFDVKLAVEQDHEQYLMKLQINRNGIKEDMGGLEQLCRNWVWTLYPCICEQCNANAQGQETTTAVKTSNATPKATLTKQDESTRGKTNND